MGRARAVLVTLTALVVLASACGGGSESESGSGRSTPVSEFDGEIASGGEATLIVQSDAQSLDPTTVINSNTQGSTLLNAIYDVLFTVDPDGEVVPRLATGFSTTDGLTWTLTLREGVTFTDGTPFDANAVKAQWERVNGNIRAATAASVLDRYLESLTVVDPLTLHVQLTTPNFQFHHAVVWGSLVWVPSPTAVAAEGDDFAQNPVGAGPFTIASRTPGAETVLERNPDYWEEGSPKLDTLTLAVINDEQQAKDTFETEGADASLLYREDDAAEHYRVESIPLIGGNCWLFGTNGVFADLRARQAVYDALDMDQLNENVFEGKQTVARSLFPEGTEFHNPDISFPEPDPAEAQRLFDELAAEGNPVSFTIKGTTGNQAQMVEVQTQLQAFDNVEVEVETVDPATYGTSLFSGDFDLAVYGVTGMDPIPAVESFRSDWMLPIASMGSPEVDAALDATVQTADHDARQAAFDELQTLVNDQFLFKWMMQNFTYATMHEDVAGLELYGQGSVLVHGFGRVA